MLKNIDPLLAPDLLKVLCEMGHGDEIVLADANFTAHSLARGKPIIRLPGVGMREACAAVLSVLPLDAAVAQPVTFMQVGDTPPGYRSALQRDVIGQMCARGDAGEGQCEAVERFAFYERVGRAFAIVQTGEMQAYSNFVFKKGVIAHALVP
ncbi:RbsD/FucU domain-containing protein [Variovorax robiniae]|uniref:RbsD/FucU domain-containing protein n=1 Tax=Variovorax robiniae TaxID=1836199 RepID=A0ABU8X6W4_9BURK